MQRACDVGDRPTATFTFYDLDGVLINPSTVKVVTRSPVGTETTYTYGVAVELSNPSTGVFEFLFPQLTAAGRWYIRCNGSGSVTSSLEDSFEVRASGYTTPLP